MKKDQNSPFGGFNQKEMMRYVVAGMDNHEFELEFQPILISETGCIEAIEAFVRWNNSPIVGFDMTMLKCDDIEIPLCYYYFKLLSEAMAKVKTQCGDLKFSINIAAKRLLEQGFADYLESILSIHNNCLSSLILEISECRDFVDNTQFEKVIYDLSHKGVTFALDDYDTGYATLVYLNQLPISILKINHTYIPRHDTNYDYKVGSIFESIIQLCQCINVSTIAKGIENKEEEILVRNLGVDMMQGTFFYQPMSQQSLIEMLKQTEATYG